MKASEVMDVNSRSGPKGKAKLRSVEVEHAKNGGYIVQHRFEQNAGPYREAEQHVFGKGEHKEMMAHVAKHLGVAQEKSEDVKPDADSAAGTAT